MTAFDKTQVSCFRFVRCGFDPASGVASLVYAFDQGPELVETITVPGAPFQLDGARAEAAERALRLLHLFAGVSYYKAAVPAQVAIDSYQIDAATAALVEDLYLHGLGEFAYRNGLNLHGRFKLPADAAPAAAARAVGLREHALVAIGGGKDSLVSIEALRAAGVAQTVTWIGGSQLIRACAERTGLPTLNIGRTLAPALFELNQQGAYNGHIPVTAINSMIMLFAALLVGADQVVFSNEHSASYGSLATRHRRGQSPVVQGLALGARAGRARRTPCRRRPALLLPAAPAVRSWRWRASSPRTTTTTPIFSSCNRNFHIMGERPVNRWCGVCPKCHFVFLALAPFMPKTRLVMIFGRNLLDDASQAGGFDALLEFQDHKPFECVGEGRESRASMATLAARPEWKEDVLVQRFAREIQPQLPADELLLAPQLELGGEHRIPAPLWERVRANFAA